MSVVPSMATVRMTSSSLFQLPRDRLHRHVHTGHMTPPSASSADAERTDPTTPYRTDRQEEVPSPGVPGRTRRRAQRTRRPPDVAHRDAPAVGHRRAGTAGRPTTCSPPGIRSKARARCHVRHGHDAVGEGVPGHPDTWFSHRTAAPVPSGVMGGTTSDLHAWFDLMCPGAIVVTAAHVGPGIALHEDEASGL